MRSLRLLCVAGCLGLILPACSDDATVPNSQDSQAGRADGSDPPGDGGDDGDPVREDGQEPEPDGSKLDGSKPDGATPKDGGGGCTNQCTENAQQCSGAGYQRCEKQANGCTDWGSVTPCGAGEICSGGQCMKNCINQCSVGARMCQGVGYVVCEMKSSGCTDWGSVTPCQNNEVCNGGQCVKSCVDQCTLGAKQCSGTGVQTCAAGASGCAEWGNPLPCGAGEICSGGQCKKNCTNQCTLNATRCSGPQEQTCKQMASGCTDWDTPAPCATGSCVNGKCDAGVCVKGDKRCNGTTVEECDAGGFWLLVQTCPQACHQGACTTTVTCSPVTRRCNGDIVEECNPTGTAWLYLESCLNGCTGGLCSGGCTPGETRCNGKTVEKCNTAGTAWALDQSCSQTFCTMLSTGGAACAELELKLDNTTQTLDGEHVYAGDVVLVNNSAITVGAQGWLRIRAANISIDATSSITAPPKGDDPTGKGHASGKKSCKNPTCPKSIGSTLNATAGGYGTAAPALSKTLYNCYPHRYCTVSNAGGKASGAYVTGIHMGSRGGSCTTANGGGMIDLIGTQTLKVYGILNADGGTTADGGGGDCAGGSGGGIRLVSEDLTVNGVVSVAGGLGSANGGLGRVKLLYGSKKSINTANITGALEQSLIPPMDLRSSTHPDQTRWYNDDFKTFNVSWTRPYSNNAAYFYDLTTALPTSQSQVPDTQSTWLTTESVSIDAAHLKVGANYYNVVPVGVGATVGTLQSAFKLQINSTPPTITSSSHADQSQWYGLPTAFFSWANPKSDDNYRYYYIVFDRYADTIPTKSDTKLPVGTMTTNKPNLPQSSIWYFHVIAEDTMGYLTKTARHYRVQIGPDPGMGGLSGTIKDKASNTPLSGVTVTLNRGYKTSTSATNGSYFFSNNVPAISNGYEVRATKAGYKPFTQQVAVTQGNNTSLNILLEKD